MKNMAIAYAMKKKAKKMADSGFSEEKAQEEGGFDKYPEDERVEQDKFEKTGNYVPYNTEYHEKSTVDHIAHDYDDLVDRIIKKHYSKGGMVANEGEDELSHMADGSPNNFDDLSLRDELEQHYTGDNSGDKLGDAQEDHDRADIISRIMRSRAKKDRMPHPA